MRKRWMLAATILLSGCAMVKTTSLGTTLILKPQIQAGAYSTKAVVNPYTQASINHLILKLYTFDDTEHDQGIQKSIPNADLGKSITFTNLKANTTYRIKAYAYLTADESQPISTNDANSYTDITLTNDDHPTIAALKVKLINIAFNGQGTGSLQITNGGYSYASSEGLTIPCLVSTLAGGAGGTAAGYLDGAGSVAKFTNPSGIATDGSGNIYIADQSNNLIRKITSSGVVSTLAGGAGGTIAGTLDGTGTAAKFNKPYGVAVDGSGNVYVAEFSSNLIRKVTSSGEVTTVAGGGGSTLAGYADGTGTAAKFNQPYAVAVDGAGNLYVADRGNNLIRKITSGGVVSTLAGGGGATAAGYLDGAGTTALLNAPYGITIDGSGNLYVTDRFNRLIRKITSGGGVSTVAGGGGGTNFGYADGQGTAALFNLPWGITIDGLGNLYVADRYNNVIRKITSSGMVSTLAGGSGATAAGYLDGTGTAAKFTDPQGLAIDWAGNIYVAEWTNHLIRRLK